MFYKTAYDTTLGNLTSNIKELTNGVEKYIIVDYPFIKQAKLTTDFTNNENTLQAIYLTGLGTVEDTIPPFTHSILYNDKWIATDLRSYTQVDKDNNSFYVRNEYEYSLALQRAILSSKWIVGDTSILYNFKFPHDCFASWLSETLTKRFGLNPNDQLRLQALSYIYYYTLFQDELLNAEDIDKLTIRVKGNAFITNDLLSDVFNKLSCSLTSIEDFCKECYNITGNIRLKGLTIGVLISIIGNNWYGHSAKELISVCVEHPPTWIALVYASLNLRSFKNTYISNIVNKLDKRQAGENFMKDYISVTKSCLLTDQV